MNGGQTNEIPGCSLEEMGILGTPQAGNFFQQAGWARKILQSPVEMEVGFLLDFFERALTKNEK